MAVVQRQTVEVYLFTDECRRDVSNAVRQWNWRRCNLEESSHRRPPLAVAVEVFCVSAAQVFRDRNSAVTLRFEVECDELTDKPCLLRAWLCLRLVCRIVSGSCKGKDFLMEV